MINCYFDIHITIKLDKDFIFKDQNDYLSKIINNSFLFNEISKSFFIFHSNHLASNHIIN